LSLPDPAKLKAVGYQPKIFVAGTLLWRVYVRGSKYPGAWNRFRAWGPHPSNRFDHHIPGKGEQNRKILYAAADLPHCAIAEVSQETRTIERFRDRPWLAQFAPRVDLRLADLSGSWMQAVGAHVESILSLNRVETQAWSRAIYETFDDVQGLYFRSTVNLEWFNVALYERAMPAMPAKPASDVPLRNAGIQPIIDAVALRFRFDVAPRKTK